MSHALPASLQAAIAQEAERLSRGSLAQGAAALSEHYRAGQPSRIALADDARLAAYLVARLPATYAAVSAALAAVRDVRPGFAPASLLDLCAGPGTASFAALAQWPELRALTLLDADGRLLAAAKRLGAAVHPELWDGATFVTADLAANRPVLASADLAVMSYALVELAPERIPAVARWAFAQTGDVLLFVEPGTPEGYHRILICRDALLAAGAGVLAPCPHALPCPMQGVSWCHFVERVARSRDHRSAKRGSLPFEDEPFSYLAVSRRPAERPAEGRLVGQVRLSKADVRVPVCTAGRILPVLAPRRDAAAYRRLRRLRWGDAVGRHQAHMDDAAT